MWEKLIRIFLVLLVGMTLGFAWKSLQIGQAERSSLPAIGEQPKFVGIDI